jgi:hypothetical protein
MERHALNGIRKSGDGEEVGGDPLLAYEADGMVSDLPVRK